MGRIRRDIYRRIGASGRKGGWVTWRNTSRCWNMEIHSAL